RKSPRQAGLSFARALLVSSIVIIIGSGLPQGLEGLVDKARELRTAARPALARARNGDVDARRNPAGTRGKHVNGVAEENRLLEAVRHEHDRLVLFRRYPGKVYGDLLTRDGIER